MDQINELAPTFDSQDRKFLLLSEIRDLYRYKALLFHLIRRNVTARYKRSILGVSWTLLDPLVTMLVMAIIFSAFFARDIPAYPVFLLSALVIWNFISQGSTGAITDLLNGNWLIGKVFMPKTVFTITSIGSSLVNLFLALIPLIIIIIVYRLPITTAILFLPVSLIIIIAFTIGLGLISSTFSVFFADILNIHTIGLRLIMYLSGLFYDVEKLPMIHQPLIKANPFYCLIVLFRDPIYYGRLPAPWIIIYSLIWSVGMLIIGLFVFLKFSDQISNRV